MDLDALHTEAHTLYYRIKQVDNDQQYSYSEIQSLDVTHSISSTINDVIIYPNPSSDFIKINTTNNIQQIQIIDLKGEI